jgi:hypothetical protein
MVETVNKPSLNRSAKERRNTQTLRSHSKVTVIALSIYLMFPFHVPHEISNLKQTTEKAQPQEEESVYEGVIGSILFSIMAVTVLSARETETTK